MKNTIFIILSFIVISIISCKKNHLERSLDGTWIEVAPCYVTGKCDTLTMSKDGYFNSRYAKDASYDKIDDYALEITKQNGFVKDYRIALSDDYETLTIYCYVSNLVGDCAIDMTFKKIE